MNFNLILNKKIQAKGKNKQFLLIIIFIIIFELLFSPFPILAKNAEASIIDLAPKKIMKIATNISNGALDIVNPVIKNQSQKKTNIPEKALYQSYHTLTAYNSEINQCDASPCITANGFNVCEHGIEDTIAANFLPFGTRIRIPDLFGGKIFIVRDRMNKRYGNRVDVWLKSHDNAVDFGVKNALIEVLK